MSLKDRMIAAWGGRATIRKNLAIATADAVALVVAFQFAFPEIGVEHGAVFATITRVLTGVGVWLASKAMLKVTGELHGDNG